MPKWRNGRRGRLKIYCPQGRGSSILPGGTTQQAVCVRRSISQIDNHISYHVGLKILLRKKNEFLFLKPPFGSSFDLPGGRIGREEALTPLEEIIHREIREELGDSLQYHLDKPAFQFRRYFPSRGLNVFLTVYEAHFIKGEIHLSDEHQSYQWINPALFAFQESDFLNTEEYLPFKNYLFKLSTAALKLK